MTSEKKVVPAEAKWRIESIDYRAGLAFATWREPRTPALPCASDQWPCLFFSPPNFSPEPIGNISLALSAFRGSFTPGPEDGDDEASFDSPEQIAEFVRRSYVGSASGDGAEGGGDNQPILPVDPENNVPRLEFPEDNTTESEATYSTLLMVKEFEKEVNNRTGDRSKRFSWHTKGNIDCRDALLRGALLVLRDIVMRAPRSNDASTLHEWHTKMRSFGGAVSRLGLWPGLFSVKYVSHLARLLRPLVNQEWWPRWLRFDSTSFPLEPETIMLLFTSGIALDDPDGWMFYRQVRHRRTIYFGHQADKEDPMQLLQSLPLPEQFSSLLDTDMARGASLYHLLPIFFSVPQTILSSPSCREIIDVVLFSCGCVVTAAKTCLPIPVTPFLSGPTEQQQVALQKISATVADWMLEHMPAIAFTPKLESVIAGAKGVRYA